MLNISDENRVRTLTLNRPEVLNAFSEALCDAMTQALLAAAEDQQVAVAVITGAGRAFSAGADLVEMQAKITGPRQDAGQHGFFRIDPGHPTGYHPCSGGGLQGVFPELLGQFAEYRHPFCP